MKTILTGLVLFLMYISPTLGLCSQQDDTSPIIMLRGENLTIKADNTDARLLFQLLDYKSDIRIHYFGDNDATITADIENRPLDESLGMITKSFNHSIIYGPGKAGEGLVITELYIYSRPAKKQSLHTPTDLAKPSFQKSAAPIEHLPPQFHLSPGGIAVESGHPQNSDPLVSMNAIDPLVRFDDGRPMFDPAMLPRDHFLEPAM